MPTSISPSSSSSSSRRSSKGVSTAGNKQANRAVKREKRRKAAEAAAETHSPTTAAENQQHDRSATADTHQKNASRVYHARTGTHTPQKGAMRMSRRHTTLKHKKYRGVPKVEIENQPISNSLNSSCTANGTSALKTAMTDHKRMIRERQKLARNRSLSLTGTGPANALIQQNIIPKNQGHFRQTLSEITNNASLNSSESNNVFTPPRERDAPSAQTTKRKP